MTIPRKKSRPLTVAGREFRWMAKPKKDWNGRVESVRVTIEDQETGEVRQFTQRSWDDGSPRSVKPSDVKERIFSLFDVHDSAPAP